MSTVSVVLRVLPPAAALVCAVLLARSAAVRWSAQRAARAYELPEDYRPAARRAVSAGAVLLAGAALAVALPCVRLGSAGSGSGAAAPAQPAPAPLADPAGPGGARPGRPVRRPGHRARPSAAPVRPTSPAPDAASDGGRAAPRTIGLPAGGTLVALPDGTRVWLPPQYARRSAADLRFPVVVAYLPVVAARDEELYPALARQVALAKADPFVVVEPAGCAADPLAALTEAARRYRLLAAVTGRGMLGEGPLAPCAVRAALAHPGTFGAFAGVSGRYDRSAVPVPRTAPSTAPRLLLTSGVRELTARRSAYALRTALRAVGVRARIVDSLAPDPRLGGGGRRRALAVAAQYLTEHLDGPARTTDG